MGHTSQIGKWGNSLAVRIPTDFADELGVREGATVRLTCVGQQLIIDLANRRYTLSEMVEGINSDNLHDAIDTDGGVGAEEW
jgi:antitoxin MazE